MPLKVFFNSLIASLIACFFAISFKYIGIYLIILSYFSSLPIFISTFYFGLTGILIASLSCIFIITSFTSFNVGILFFITNILPVILILFDKSKNRLSYINFLSKITVISSIFFTIFNLIYADKIKTITKNLTDHFSQNLNNNIIIDQSILDLAPAMMVFSWNIVLLLNLILARFLIIKYFNTTNKFFDNLINIKLQRWLVALFIIFLIPAALLNSDNGTLFRSLALIYAIPITIQGLGVIHVLFKQRKINDFLIYTFYTFIFVIPVVLPIIAAIGVLEHIYNFRNLKFEKNA